MKDVPLSSCGIVALFGAIVVVGAGCAELGRDHASGTFASVCPILESTCVHCHGSNHLPNMPAFPDTRALARLIGPANLIVPGHPERSRFFHVVTFSDQQPGAMPPTGHAISKSDVEGLRAWIAAGAPVPENMPLIARGEGPRSR